MHVVLAVIMKNRVGNGQDRSVAWDLASYAAGFGDFHDFLSVVSWEEWDLWLICPKPPESDWHVF